MGRTIRVSDETYRKLCEFASRLWAELEQTVLMDEAIRYLMEMSEPRSKISDLAGLWM